MDLPVSWNQNPCEIVNVNMFRIMSHKCIALQEGCYEYKYIVDGEWTINENEPVTLANKDGHVNNFVQVRFSYLASYLKR